MKTKDGVDNGKGETATTDKEKGRMLNEFFCGIFTTESDSNVPIFATREHEDVLTSFNITYDEVYKKLAALKPNKSPGPDGFHQMLLRELAQELAEPLTIIFHKCLKEGCVPPSWKEAHVTPIYKTGKKSISGNYKPVGLTYIIRRLIKSLIRGRAVHHITNSNIFTDCQHSFIKGRSC